MTPHDPGVRGRTFWLAVAGGVAFWLANLAISLTPLAAEYRSALSIDYVPMLFEALVGGLVIGLVVAYSLVRLVHRGVARPALTSLALSAVALAVVTVVIEVPAKFLTATADPVRYFLIAMLFNGLRILALGAVTGLLVSRRQRVPV